MARFDCPGSLGEIELLKAKGIQLRVIKLRSILSTLHISFIALDFPFDHCEKHFHKTSLALGRGIHCNLCYTCYTVLRKENLGNWGNTIISVIPHSELGYPSQNMLICLLAESPV